MRCASVFIVILLINWYSKSTTLPQLYFKLSSRRDVEVRDLRRLEKTGLKVSKLQLDLGYFERCLELGVCPPFLRFKPPNVKAYKDVKFVYEKAVKNEIKLVNQELKKVKSLHKTLMSRVADKVSLLEKLTLVNKWNLFFKKEAEFHLKRQNNKLRRLWLSERCRSPDCLINLSKKELSVTEENLIRLGLKHHILPKEIKGEDLKVEIEGLVDGIMRDKEREYKANTGTYRFMPVSSELKDELKFAVNSFSSKCKNICSSKKNELHHKTLRKLASDKNIKVCKFDKGNGVVILDSDDYFQKLDSIVLDQSKFEEIKMSNGNHPIIKNEGSLQKYLRLNLKPYVDESVYTELYPTGSQPGKLYGMCKVHKPGYPLRPVISMINTAEYKLAKWLDSYIKPNIPTRYSVSSTGEFLNGLNEVIFDKGDRIVSFDVVSLYTNIPLAETIALVVDELYSEKSKRVPPVPKQVFKHLLEEATGGMFIYKDKLMRQVDGVAMGSPLGPSLANFFLGHIEELSVFTNESICPKMYMRYVDDIFAVFPKDISHIPFLEHLNHLHENLKFTVEESQPESPFPFLNVSIKINGENADTWVFRKNTDTGVMLNFNAVVPNAWKVGLIRCLLNTGKQICSSETLFGLEVENLKRRFTANGYPKVYFEEAYNKFLGRVGGDKAVESDNKENERKYVFGVPFVGTASRQYKKKVTGLIKEHLGVDIFGYFSSCKVGSFFSLKSRTPFALKARVVYKFQCLNDSDVTYIGKTERHIATRAKEHLASKEGGIAKHLIFCETCKNSDLNAQNFGIMKQCKNDYRCLLNEALLIQKFKPVLNKQQQTTGKSYLLRVF